MITDLLKKAIFFFLRLPNSPIKNVVRNVFYGEVISERIVEYAVCFKSLAYSPSRKIKVLDVGCYYSNFPIQLASMGYSVTGIDLQDYELSHPNFNFIKGDIREYDFGQKKFDIVTCISTLEHIGIGVYGDEKDERGDVEAVEVFNKILKENGQLLLTVPFGKRSVTKSQRNYGWSMLSSLLKNFYFKEKRFYTSINGKWVPVSRETASKVRNYPKTKSVVFISAFKK